MELLIHINVCPIASWRSKAPMNSSFASTFAPSHPGALAAGLCGSSSDKEEINTYGEGACNMPCGGDSTQMCGTCLPLILLCPAPLAAADCFHICRCSNLHDYRSSLFPSRRPAEVTASGIIGPPFHQGPCLVMISNFEPMLKYLTMEPMCLLPRNSTCWTYTTKPGRVSPTPRARLETANYNGRVDARRTTSLPCLVLSDVLLNGYTQREALAHAQPLPP